MVQKIAVKQDSEPQQKNDSITVNVDMSSMDVGNTVWEGCKIYLMIAFILGSGFILLARIVGLFL